MLAVVVISFSVRKYCGHLSSDVV